MANYEKAWVKTTNNQLEINLALQQKVRIRLEKHEE